MCKVELREVSFPSITAQKYPQTLIQFVLSWATIIRAAEYESGYHITIIALTAHALTNVRENPLNQGFDGYIAKSLDIFVLVDQIKYCVDNYLK